MTLEEAIIHAEEVADVCEFEASKYDMTDAYESHVACQEGECAAEHRQLAEWLKELKTLRKQDVPNTNDGDMISKRAVLDILYLDPGIDEIREKMIKELPSAQPEYEELTPEEAAAEISSGSIMSALYWFDVMIEIKQMGYAICRKK